MSLSIYLSAFRKTEVYYSNITHNLNTMAQAVKCGDHSLYEYLWRPEEIGISKAGELTEPLREGLAELKSKPEVYEKYNSPNGRGLYKNFVPFVEEYLDACEKDPDSDVEVQDNFRYKNREI